MPVGLDFQDYKKAESRLLIRFGEPIIVAAFGEKYCVSAAVGFRSLTEAVSEGLKKEMIHIEDENSYNEIISILRLANAYLSEKKPAEGTNLRLIEDKMLLERLKKCRRESPVLYKHIIEQQSRLFH